MTLNTSGTGGNASLTNIRGDGTGGVDCRRQPDGGRQHRQPDPDRRADGHRHLVVHDLASNATITLTAATNALTGAVSLNTSGTGGNASLTNNRRTVLAASNVGGNLTVIDSTGSLTQTGVLTVGGTSSFTTSASNATIT